MGSNVNFSFNKGQAMNITNFDGVSKEELLKKEGLSDKQKALIESIFAKYDDGDGILTADEYKVMSDNLALVAKDDNLGKGELKQFNKNYLGVDKKAYSMEDLQAVIGMMTDGTDSITGVQTDAQGNLNVTYKPGQDGSVKTSQFAHTDNQDAPLRLLSDTIVLNGVTTKIEYDEDGTTIKSKTKSYNQGGNTFIDTLDPAHGDRITNRIQNKGLATQLTTEYTYLDDNTTNTANEEVTKRSDGNIAKRVQREANGDVVTETYDKDEIILTKKIEDAQNNVTQITYEGGKPKTVIITDAQGHTTQQVDYTYDGDNKIETVTEFGENNNVTSRTRDTYSNNRLTGHVDVDENGNIQEYKHTVEPGENWYNIVQAKYGVTDHKTIMEIVHQLKDNAGIDYSSVSLPKEITLPGEIKLKSGEKVSLKNTGALVNLTGSVGTDGSQLGPKITPPQPLAQTDLPPTIAPLTDAQQNITIPTFEVNMDNAGKTVAVEGGQYYKYDSQGRVTDIYPDETAYNAGKHSTVIHYDAQGNITTYQLNTYDEESWTAIRYDGNGAFTDRYIDDQIDPAHPKQFGRQTHYNADGSINYILDNFQYDEQGRLIAYDNFLADGSWRCSRRLDYGNDGTCQTRYYDNTDRGRMTKIESFE